RVAADGNPGLHDATPSGLETQIAVTQGSRGRQPWATRRNPFGVGNSDRVTQGSRGRQPWATRRNPFGVGNSDRVTQGSRGRQPWATRRNPFGVGNSDRGYPGWPRTATLGYTTQPLRGWKLRPRLPRVAADGNPGLHDATPSGLETQIAVSQGSRGRQPWAGRRNPFGVGNSDRGYPG